MMDDVDDEEEVEDEEKEEVRGRRKKEEVREEKAFPRDCFFPFQPLFFRGKRPSCPLNQTHLPISISSAGLSYPNLRLPTCVLLIRRISHLYLISQTFPLSASLCLCVCIAEKRRGIVKVDSEAGFLSRFRVVPLRPWAEKRAADPPLYATQARTITNKHKQAPLLPLNRPLPPSLRCWERKSAFGSTPESISAAPGHSFAPSSKGQA